MAGRLPIENGLAVPIRVPPNRAIMALGGELKSVISLMREDKVCSSDVFGDLANAEAYRRFEAGARAFMARTRGTPLVLAHDMHPAYLSTAWAMSRGSKLERQSIQHHHAHVASCLAEHGENGPVIGVACDGTGYGADGTIWGCEVLICDLRGFERAGHLQPFALPGGDAAARQTWRPALSLVRHAYGQEWRSKAGVRFQGVPRADLTTVERMLERNVNCVKTSSLGRLFDGVAFLLGLCDANHREAQAAGALENCARAHPARRAPGGLPFEVLLPPAHQGSGLVIDVRPLIRAIVDGMTTGRSRSELAAEFHETVAAMLATTVEMAADRAGLRQAALSGGCFQNRLLSDGLADLLERKGIQVMRHQTLSPGDAGLSLGQAVIAAARLEERKYPPSPNARAHRTAKTSSPPSRCTLER